MIRKTILSLGFLALGVVAIAGPPFVTDDPEPVDYQHWEVYLAAQSAHASGGAVGTLPQVEVNYGVLPNLQLHVIAPVAFAAPPGGSRQSGYGDTELGAKYRFVDEADDRPQVGVFPLVEVPTGESARGLGSGHTQAFLPVWLQKSLGSWTTYGGAGYWINPGAENRNWWFTGWLIQKQVSHRLTVGAEVFHQTASSDTTSSATKMNVGIIWDVDDTRHVLASVGPTLRGPGGYQAYLGIQLTLGPAK